MPGKAAKVPLSEKQLELLHKISRETTASVRLVQRSRIILLAFEGWLNEEIADEVSLNQRPVGRWRRRWQESFDALVSIDAAAQRPRCVRPSKRFSVTHPGVAVQGRLLQNR